MVVARIYLPNLQRHRHRAGRRRGMSGLQMKYFVLKPGGSDAYAEASREACVAYAESIREENAELANDLIAWVDKEQPEHFRFNGGDDYNR